MGYRWDIFNHYARGYFQYMNTIKKLIFVTFLFIFSATSSASKEFIFNDEAIKKFYEIETKELLKLTEEINTDATIALSLKYYYGYGVRQDYDEAFEVLDEIMTDGTYALQITYVTLMQYLLERPKPPIERMVYVLKKFTTGIENGDKEYLYLFGELLYKTDINSLYNNKLLAFKWLRASEEKNYIPAIKFLADIYLHGRGYVSMDKNKSYSLYLRAANLGDSESQLISGYNYIFGRGITKNYRKGVEWYTAAANQGNALASFRLGNINFEGSIVQRDVLSALNWFKKASLLHSHAESQTKLAEIYSEGVEGYIEVDFIEAYMWASIASHNGGKGNELSEKLHEKMSIEDIHEAQDRSLKCLNSKYMDC